MLKFNKRIVLIDLKNKEKDHLMINSLNGLVDILHYEEYIIFSLWKEKGLEIIPKTKQEQELYKKLLQRKYIIEKEEEHNMEQSLLKMVKEQRTKKEELCDNAVFVLSYNCNFACPYCYEEKKHGATRMTKEMVDKVFGFYKTRLQKIGLFGGEPLLPANREIISYIIDKAPQASYYIISNGYYIEEYIDLLKKINITIIQITLDGTEEIHNHSRILKNGEGTYKKILKGIQLLMENQIPVTIRMNVSNDNLNECYKEIDLLHSYDWARGLRFEMQPLFQINNIEQKSIYRTFLEKEFKENYKNEILQHLSVIGNFLYSGKRMHPVLKACDREVSGRYYDALGYVYSCILAVGDTEKAIGRYYPEYELKEKSFATRDITTIKECQECPNAFLCGGGCPNALPGYIDLYSPNCSNFIMDKEFFIPCIYQLKFESE